MHMYNTIVHVTCMHMGVNTGFSPEFLQLVVHLCIVNNLGGLANNRYGQLHVHELHVAMQKKQKQKLVKSQLTLFGE